ncbi:sugar phosphate isomerase/epimerase family protein, partial [Halocatena marina]
VDSVVTIVKLALSTLGCPEWDIEQICSVGREVGYDGIDFRGYQEQLDVTRHPLFTEQSDTTASKIAHIGLRTSAFSSSIRLCDADAREANVTEAERLVEVATAFDADRIRVFGGGDSDRSTDELARIGGDTMNAILDIDGASDLRWMVETHDEWTSSQDCRRLLDELPEEHTGILWDAAHTIRLADETPTETLDILGDRIEYVHIKDAVLDMSHDDATDDGYVYTLPGTGDLPMNDVIAALHDDGYDGWLAYEHEKRWHPSIPEPEEAFPAFVDWFRSLE